MKDSKRTKQLEQRRQAKASRMKKVKGNSDYAKKKEYLHRNGGWGFDYPDGEKSWK